MNPTVFYAGSGILDLGLLSWNFFRSVPIEQEMNRYHLTIMFCSFLVVSAILMGFSSMNRGEK